jgi:hypothetical protein
MVILMAQHNFNYGYRVPYKLADNITTIEISYVSILVLIYKPSLFA